jgi:protein-L-isoaspartate(D-aspartate) O-methyltransferase
MLVFGQRTNRAATAALEEPELSTEDIFEPLREQMVAEVEAETAALEGQIGLGVLSERVVAAMGRVPRHEFVPVELKAFAYLNRPLPIGFGKTISQPFIVALMTELLELTPQHRVLEVGTGFGYQAAILAELAQRVYSVEIVPEISAEATRRLSRLGYKDIELRVGNGRLGWPEHAPFDRIIVTTAPDLIPAELLQQLKRGGRMVIPAGIPDHQQLILVERSASGQTSTREVLPVRFSEMEEDGGPVGTS